MNLNKAFVIGNLTRDPELKSLPSGNSVCNFSLATNRYYTDSDGNKQQNTEFHNIVVFGKTAENVSQYLSKGSIALVEGRLQTRSWEDQDGNKKYKTEIVASRVQFGPRKSGGGGGQSSGNQGGNSNSGNQDIDYPDNDDDISPEDIPF